jgi:2-aminobenzoylacetyl-CoA thioesterase
VIFGETGRVKEGLYVLGLPWTPAYLLDGPRPVLFEAGFACAGRLYADDIREVLGDRQPEILFLTHVHYDHCGATSYLRQMFPGIKVASSALSAEIIQRPNAQKLMSELSLNLIPSVAAVEGIDPERLLYEPFEPFQADLILRDGETVRLGEDVTVKVFAVPGHTRDLLSYYIPEKKILFATESVGNLDHINQIVPEFLVDYESYLNHIARLSQLDIEVLCLGHQFVISDGDVKPFFVRTVKETERFKARVEELLMEEHGEVDLVVERVKAEVYDINPGPKQLEQAYLINLRAQVSHLAENMKRRQ